MEIRKIARHYAIVLLSVMQHNNLTGAKIVSASRGSRHLNLDVKLKAPKELDKALALSEQVAYSSNVPSVLALRKEGLLSYQFSLKEHLWELYSRENTPANAIGFTENRLPVEFSFLDSRPHTAFAGTTGSGKTESMKSAIYSIASSFTPEEVKIVILDIFNNYSGFNNLAHLFLPVATGLEDIGNALLNVEEELKSRIDNNAKDKYRLVLIADEAETIFNNTDQIKAIAKTGRQFKLNLILGSQDFKEQSLPGVTREINNRYVGLVQNASISSRLAGKGVNAHRLLGKGDFLHVLGSQITRFQVSQVLEADYNKLPRAEIRDKKPVAKIEDVKNYAAGRPALEIDPELAALYFYLYPERLSYNVAADKGISRRQHEKHKDFIEKFTKEYGRLLQ